MKKRKFYRAVVAYGITHGGGGLNVGVYRKTYKQAAEDLKRFGKPAEGDSFSCVEVIESKQAPRS